MAKTYRIQSFFSEEKEDLGIALTKAEAQALEWLSLHNTIELISASPTVVISKKGTYIYIITLTFKQN